MHVPFEGIFPLLGVRMKNCFLSGWGFITLSMGQLLVMPSGYPVESIKTNILELSEVTSYELISSFMKYGCFVNF